MTDAQKETLTALKNYKEKNGYFPTCHEISKFMKIDGPSANHRLKVLMKKGIIKMPHGKLKIVGECDD